MKFLKVILIAVVILAVLGGAVGAYLHFKPADKPSDTLADESLVLTTKDYGTFTFEKSKMFANRFENNKMTISYGLLAPNSDLNAILLDNYNEEKYKYKLVVIPEFNSETNTQNPIAGTHINYEEKVVASVRYYSSPVASDIEAYVLKDNVITYNKPYEEIPEDEKRFTIGFYRYDENGVGTNYIFIWMNGVFQKNTNNEYVYFTSNTNYVFASMLITEYLM